MNKALGPLALSLTPAGIVRSMFPYEVPGELARFLKMLERRVIQKSALDVTGH